MAIAIALLCSGSTSEYMAVFSPVFGQAYEQYSMRSTSDIVYRHRLLERAVAISSRVCNWAPSTTRIQVELQALPTRISVPRTALT